MRPERRSADSQDVLAVFRFWAALLREPFTIEGVAVFFVSYVFAELRRRRGRTILTASGLAVGVALVISVNALSTGLDRAQAKVLEPLTGVGTDMSVTRPIKITQGGGGPFGNLSKAEQKRLRSEQGGGGPLNFRNLKPG